MKTETLMQAIQFAMNLPEVQNHIEALEALPHRFKIHRIMATVTDEEKKTIRVLLNFSEKSNPNDYKEDALIDIQANSPGEFKLLAIIPFEAKP